MVGGVVRVDMDVEVEFGFRVWVGVGELGGIVGIVAVMGGIDSREDIVIVGWSSIFLDFNSVFRF